jgi:hypothetical protein
MYPHIPARFYAYNYQDLFVRVSVTAAIAVIVYSMLFGITW